MCHLNLHLCKLLSIILSSKKTEERKSVRHLYIFRPLEQWSNYGSLLLLSLGKLSELQAAPAKPKCPLCKHKNSQRNAQQNISLGPDADTVWLYTAQCEVRWQPPTQGKFTTQCKDTHRWAFRRARAPHITLLTCYTTRSTAQWHHQQAPGSHSEICISRRTWPLTTYACRRVCQHHQGKKKRTDFTIQICSCLKNPDLFKVLLTESERIQASCIETKRTTVSGKANISISSNL